MSTPCCSPRRPRVRPAVCLLFLAALPAGAVIFSPNPYAVTVGAATLTVDIQRIPAAGEKAGFDDDELDTFEWFAPNTYPAGPSVRLPRAAVLASGAVRVQVPAER